MSPMQSLYYRTSDISFFSLGFFCLACETKLAECHTRQKKESGNTVIRFYPKGENAKNPDGIVFMLSLDGTDRKKMSEIIS